MTQRSARPQSGHNGASAGTSAGKAPASGRPFTKGNDPRRGRGPSKGAANAGRPPIAYKARMMALADRGALAAELEGVLDNPSHPHWMQAWKFVVEQAYGRAVQPLSGDPEAPLTFRIVRE